MTLLLSACSVFGVRSGYEQASYEVIDRFGENTEVRRYPPQLVAEAGATASDEKTGRNQAFRMLFDYISGANRSQAKVAMTTPVETAAQAETFAMTAPVETQVQAAGRYAMRFFLPAAYTLETAPQPTDSNVQILELPERTLAVLRFAGSTGAENVARHLDELRKTVDESRWRLAGEPTTMFYDPPWTIPFLRRNEVPSRSPAVRPPSAAARRRSRRTYLRGVAAGLCPNCGREVPAPVSMAAHRWRYARVATLLGSPCLVDDERGIGACGDWCLGSNIEAAFRSGQAMAETILALYGVTVALGAS